MWCGCDSGTTSWNIVPSEIHIYAVGYLEFDTIPSLAFVQVSLSPYSSYSTKINDLATTKAPKDNSKSILKYCHD